MDLNFLYFWNKFIFWKFFTQHLANGLHLRLKDQRFIIHRDNYLTFQSWLFLIGGSSNFNCAMFSIMEGEVLCLSLFSLYFLGLTYFLFFFMLFPGFSWLFFNLPAIYAIIRTLQTVYWSPVCRSLNGVIHYGSLF